MKMVTMTLDLPADLQEYLTNLAHEQNISVNQLITNILQDFIDLHTGETA